MQCNDYKEVRYDIYCTKCEHEKTPESEEPCYECLEESVNLHSHKPINWEEKDERKRK